MKPTKNKVACPALYGRTKMLFETESKAKNFIKFNGQELTDDVSKLRTYYCDACCGYHITSKPLMTNYKYDRTDKLIEAYHKTKNCDMILPIEKKLKRKESQEIAEKYVEEIPNNLQFKQEIREWAKEHLKNENDTTKQMFFKLIYKKVGIHL